MSKRHVGQESIMLLHGEQGNVRARLLQQHPHTGRFPVEGKGSSSFRGGIQLQRILLEGLLRRCPVLRKPHMKDPLHHIVLHVLRRSLHHSLLLLSTSLDLLLDGWGCNLLRSTLLLWAGFGLCSSLFPPGPPLWRHTLGT